MRVVEQFLKALLLFFFVQTVQQIAFGAEDSDDIVNIVFINRDPGVTGFFNYRKQFSVGNIQRNSGHGGTVRQKVAGGHIGEVQHIFDHFLFARFNGAVFFSHIHQSQNLILRHILVQRLGSNAQHPDKDLCGGIYQTRKGKRKTIEEADESITVVVFGFSASGSAECGEEPPDKYDVKKGKDQSACQKDQNIQKQIRKVGRKSRLFMDGIHDVMAEYPKNQSLKAKKQHLGAPKRIFDLLLLFGKERIHFFGMWRAGFGISAELLAVLLFKISPCVGNDGGKRRQKCDDDQSSPTIA